MSPAVPTLLIIEDEPVLRSSMVRGLSRLEGLQVLGAGSVGEACACLDRQPPSMVITDIDLPDRSGIEILGELGSRGLRVPVVFVSGFLRAYRAQIPPHADVQVFEKPVPMEELRGIVETRLGVGNQVPAVPAAAPFGVPEYLQLACLGRHSVEILVGGPAGGTVLVVDGQPWSAVDGQGGGEGALRRLVFGNAPVACRTLMAQAGERNLHGSWEHLLLEAARLQDEGGLGGGGGGDDAALDAAFSAKDDPTGATPLQTPLPPQHVAPPVAPPPVVEPAPAPQESQFDQLWERAVAALLDRQHALALALLDRCKVLAPQDKRVEANVVRLRAMGVTPAPLEEP